MILDSETNLIEMTKDYTGEDQLVDMCTVGVEQERHTENQNLGPRSQSSSTRYVRGRSVFRDFSPNKGLKNRSTSRGRKYDSSPSQESQSSKKEIKTQMCQITKAVKGGLNLQEAEKLIDQKIEEMCICDTEDEGENEVEQMFCENYIDTTPSLENLQTTIDTLQSMAASLNIVSTMHVEDDKEKEILKVDCGAPKSCGGMTYITEYLPTMGLSLEAMPKVMTNDVFLFGTTKFPTKGKIVVPLKIMDTEGHIHYKECEIHLIEHTIGLLVGLNTLDKWGSDVKISKSGISLPKPGQQEYIISGKRQGGHIAIKTIPANKNDKFYPKQPSPFNPKKTYNKTNFIKNEFQTIKCKEAQSKLKDINKPNMVVTVNDRHKNLENSEIKPTKENDKQSSILENIMDGFGGLYGKFSGSENKQVRNIIT